jgi:adenosine deaminase
VLRGNSCFPSGNLLPIRYNPEHRLQEDVLRTRALLFLYLLIAASLFGQPAKRAKVQAISSPEERTARYFESIRNQPSLLLAFLRAMPKGGDLHNHLSGSIYAESYIRWAAQDGLCLNRQTFAFAAPACDADKGLVPAEQLLKDSVLYQQVINAQSMRFFNGPESGHDHFFNAFGKFAAVSRTHQGDMLAEVASRAAAQHVSYMEILLAPDKGEAGRLAADLKFDAHPDFNAARERLTAKGLADVVAHSRANLDEFEQRMRDGLQCTTSKADPGCKVIVHYQYEIHRGLPPEVVFAEMLVGFSLASTDPRVVDVNPVMPEDAYVPMRDFELHMRMLDYLHGLYPRVPLSLHAGELWTGLVPPNGLRHHIRDSIELGHASRIGHGVDVMFEDDPSDLLKEMSAKKIAVEINLSSNDLILGVRGEEHPFPVYLRAGVPVVISTDDEGVSRSDITQEYLRAVTTYSISYKQLKQIVRNSLEYSFAAGDKSGLQSQIEQDFAKFESGECCKLPPQSAKSASSTNH